LNKKIVSVIMTLILTVVISENTFAAPNTNASNSLEQTQTEKKELQSKVQVLDKQIDEVLKKIDSNKKDMNKIAQDIKDTENKLTVTENNSKAQVDLFKKRVRAMYISGTDSYLQVLFAADNLNDFISRVDMITKIISFDNQIIAEFKEKQQAIANQKEALSLENSKLETLKISNESVLSKLSKDIKEQKTLLSKVTEKENQLLAIEAAKTSKELAYNNSKKSSTLSRGTSKPISYSQVLNMESTAYSGDGITASGAVTKRDVNGYSTIAVDPRVIPLGSRVYVEGYGYAIAEDTGSAIKGNIIDVFFQSKSEAISWGRRSVNIYILN